MRTAELLRVVRLLPADPIGSGQQCFKCGIRFAGFTANVTNQPAHIGPKLAKAAPHPFVLSEMRVATCLHRRALANTRFVVTNLTHTPKDIYDGWYTPRGEMENRIKEQQLGLFADRTSCHRFIANQLRLLLASAAYVLIEHLRREALRGTELARAQVSTIRLKLFKIAARVRVSVRRVVLHLSSGYPYQAILRRITARLVLT